VSLWEVLEDFTKEIKRKRKKEESRLKVQVHSPVNQFLFYQKWWIRKRKSTNNKIPMSKKSISTGENVPLALFFAVFVVGVIIASFIWKSIGLLRQSKFDGKHQYVLLLEDADKSEIVSFNPDTQNIIQVFLTGNYNINDLAKTLEIPIDGKISVNDPKKPIPSILAKTLFSKNKKSLTVADIIRLWLFSKSIKTEDYQNITFQMPIDDNSVKEIAKIFTDRTLYQEAKTITVVNATGENGIGGRFAKLLTNIGGNVIVISTGDISQKSKIQFVGEKSYSLSRISQILEISPKPDTSKSAISDITVIIGEDRANANIF